MEEIKLIKDIVASPTADTLSNKLMNTEVELNRTRNFLSDATNCCTDEKHIYQIFKKKDGHIFLKKIETR